MICGHVLGVSMEQLIMGEAVDGFTNGVITRKFNESMSLNNYRAYYVPPTIGSIRYAAAHEANTYRYMYKNNRLDQNPISWQPINAFYGARVCKIVPNSSGAVPITAVVKTSQEAIDMGFASETITVSQNISGCGTIVLPYGWMIESLSSTSTVEFNIALQIVYSDRDVFTPIRGL
jgi:hypothetical protein